MKKCIAVFLILALFVTMGTTVAAATAPEAESGNSQEVRASYEEGKEDKTVISVDISWEQMSFTYKGASMPTWNAEEHRYEGEATEAGWAAGNGTITICNNSNTVLQTLISYDKEPDFNAVDMKFTADAPYIGSAYTDDRVDEEGNVIGTPCQITVKAIPKGELKKETEDNTKIGTITITINPEVDVYEMMDSVEMDISVYKGKVAADLRRGDVFFTAGTDIETLHELVNAALETYIKADATTQEKNIAINKALSAYYGALDIVQ